MHKLFKKKVKGEGHFVAVMLIIVVVVVMGVFYKINSTEWFKEKWDTVETKTSVLFDDIGTSSGTGGTGGTN